MYEGLLFAAAALTIAAMFYLPKKVNLGQRVVSGLVLFIVGWAGIVGGLVISEYPVFRSATAAYIWIGFFGAATVISIVILLPAGFEWMRARRPRRQRRETWPNV